MVSVNNLESLQMKGKAHIPRTHIPPLALIKVDSLCIYIHEAFFSTSSYVATVLCCSCVLALCGEDLLA